ncbi:MAG: YybH family protein [Candidatus Acidiferrales bacterium]
MKEESLSSASAVSEIRSAIEGYREAVLHKDMRGIARYYWNSPDIVIFDVVPPLSYVGWDSFRKDWEGFFDGFKEITVYDWSDVHIEAEGNLGWMRAFIHFVGKFQDGKVLDMTTRDTAIFERKDGKWVAVHDHGSVPINFETGQAIMNAPPK